MDSVLLSVLYTVMDIFMIVSVVFIILLILFLILMAITAIDYMIKRLFFKKEVETKLMSWFERMDDKLKRQEIERQTNRV